MVEGNEFIRKMFEPVTEFHYDATSAVCAGFAFNHSVRGLFVNLAAYPRHVTLVFAWGVKLDDPESRLKGEGNQVRNLRLAGMETLKDPYIIGLMRQAAENAPMKENPLPPTRIVKIYKGPKRRP